jgi:hypothetical protein
MVKHTTHAPRDGSGFVHYKEGCLCHYCPHYPEATTEIAHRYVVANSIAEERK